MALVAESDGGVSEEAAAVGAPEWSFSESGAEGGFVEVEEFGQFEGIEVGLRLEGLFFGFGGVVVPGADVLADVAAEDPVLHLGTQVGGDGLLELDGEVADAARSVEDVGLDKGVGWAGIEAGGTGAAVVGGVGGVVVEESVGEQCGKKKVAAGVF